MSREQGSEGAVSRSQSIKEDEMAEEKQTLKRVSRRQFVKGAAVGGAGVAAAGVLASCAPAATPVPTTAPGETAAPAPTCPPAAECLTAWVPAKWDYEADVVVVGLGGAGAVTAATAQDAGAKVIVLEKAPIEGGGASRMSTAFTAYCKPEDVDGAAEYLYEATFGTTPMDVCQAWAEGIAETPEWLAEMGIEFAEFMGMGIFTPGGDFKNFPGAGALKSLQPTGGGTRIWEWATEHLQSGGTEILFDTPGKGLVQNPQTKEILGVIAESQGKTIAVKANRGVVLCTGGFELNEEMKNNYLRPSPLAVHGWPYNTGDGIKMAQAVGADLWHMNLVSSTYPTIVTPASKIGWSVGVKGPSWIHVHRYGKRFYCENPFPWHPHRSFMAFDIWDWSRTQKKQGYLAIPFYLIFDEKTRLAGPIAAAPAIPSEELGGHPEWSQDNSEEIELGWINKGDTIEELAAAIGADIDPALLEETVARWNGFCAAGEDLDFGRPKEAPAAVFAAELSPNLGAIDTPPYYGVEMWPSIFSTCGGPRKNGKAQILDTNGNPIPRLYEAGVLGHTAGFSYAVFGQNWAEIMAFGRISGRNAAAETPWE
jgi:succinate dehydrogenase/fumarate reductase flavoprotein subunit